MKKLLLCLSIAGAAGNLFAANGTVYFDNLAVFFSTGGQAPGVQTNDGIHPVASAAPGSYTVALYEGTAAGAGLNPDDLSLESVYHSSSSDYPFPGIFEGPMVTLTGAGPGQTAYLEVAGWTGMFNSWDDAVQAGALVGHTDLFANPTANPTTTPPSVPSELTGWNGNLILMATPEPATMALCGLGALTWLAIQRRK